jgi:hypothetical protein
MSAIDRWIYFEGPEPEELRGLLAALRGLAPAGAEAMEQMEVELFAKLDAEAEADPSLRGEEDGAETQEGWFWDAEGAHVAGGGAESGEPAREVARAEPSSGREEAPETSAGATAPSTVAMIPSAGAVVPSAAAMAPSAAAIPALVRAPEGLKGTSVALDIPAAVRAQMPVLPFLAPKDVPAAQRAGRTVQSPAYRSRLRETTRDGDDSIYRAVATVPFPGSTAPAGRIACPNLTLSQYASLCAQLTVAPEEWAEALKEYGVASKAVHASLDAHWREEMERDPAIRAELEEKLATYVDHVRATRMRRSRVSSPA